MADPLLNTLCSICHTNAPKYVCPGCSAQTCSLPCTQKHKSWANCSGRRDPTAFMPASRLKTASGIDHDYNFLSAIERERGRNQRDMVEERGLFTTQEVRQMDDEAGFRKQWVGETVRFEPIRGGPRVFGANNGGGEGDNSGGDGEGDDGNIPARASYLTRQVRQRLDHSGVQVVQMPVGMTRQRENTTSWNRKTKNINWCVEWIVYNNGESEDSGYKSHTRIRHKALETVPLYRALGNSMAWHRKGQQKGGQQDDDDDNDNNDDEESAYARKRRRVLIKEVKEEGRRTAMQDGDSATWVATTPYPSQNPYTGTWGLDRGASVTSWLPDAEVDARRGHRFYLLKPLTPVGKPKELIPVEPTDTLSSALRGRAVLEYPTVYILPPPLAAAAAAASTDSAAVPLADLPEGYILGSTERRERPKRNNNNNNKRKAAEKNDNDSQPPNKRQAVASGDAGIPIRGPNQRGRGGGRGGRGGQGQQGQQQQNRSRAAQDAEEGEINSDGDEVPRRPRGGRPVRRVEDRADTSSSDPDTSSDEEEEVVVDRRGPFSINSPVGDNDDGDDDDGPPEETVSSKKRSGMGLVEYGSDSEGSDEAEEGGEDEDEGADLADLKPENPELVASAIKEIVGLLSA
ncbi:hypothetical protein VPNG_05059 [Cytospora leucostoma]|uniref:Box C/D snoRNA protein 1 n=1 Tax=Cytospora leucostoma TaxID=1230097 RepID=A0A423X490_9PEZI|nr:hypothetical protein VPNG_05059 [Cytospora leucostoma]